MIFYKKNLVALILVVLSLPPLFAGSKILPLPSHQQTQTEWCWAATSKSIIEYFEGTAPAQCEIAEWARQNVSGDLDLGSEDCCTNPSGACNHWNYNWGNGASVRNIVENYSEAYFTESRGTASGSYYTLSEYQNFVDQQFLTYIRWGWKVGGGHFLIGFGYNDSMIYYQDPLPNEGPKIAQYSWVISDGIHDWTHTNLFKKEGFTESSSINSSSSALSSSSNDDSTPIKLHSSKAPIAQFKVIDANTLYVSSSETLTNLFLYDAKGYLIQEFRGLNSTYATLPLKASNQVVNLLMKTKNGSTHSASIVIP